MSNGKFDYSGKRVKVYIDNFNGHYEIGGILDSIWSGALYLRDVVIKREVQGRVTKSDHPSAQIPTRDLVAICEDHA